MRYEAYLRSRYRIITGYLGGMVAMVGLTILAPLLILPFFPEDADYALGFLATGVPLAIGGYFLWKRFSPPPNTTVTTQEGMVIVVFVWLIAILAGAIPFVLETDLNFHQAIFESTSGWTTTGLTVVDATNAPKLILMHRSTIQFVGGAGFAIIVLSAIAGISGAALSTAEGREEQLAPHVRQSANMVMRMYLLYNGFGIAALYLAGMSLFDAINHTFAAIATGGFSTRNESIAYWDDARIEFIIILLMFLGSINFLTAYTAYRRKWEAVRRNGEIRFAVVFFGICSFLLFVGTTSHAYENLDRQVRIAVFEAMSAMSTCGFTLTNYKGWNDFGWLIMIVLMMIGGGTGSTSAGIKQIRVYMLAKALMWEIRYAFLPANVVHEPVVWRGASRTYMTDRQVRQVALFVFVYVSFMLIVAGAISAHGYSLRDSLFESSSALSGVGLTSGITTPNEPNTLLWTASSAMLLGRLEFFALIIGTIKIILDGRVLLKSATRRVPTSPNWDTPIRSK